MKGNIFNSNNGISVTHVKEPSKSIFSGNLFFNTYQTAYVLPYEKSTPKITSVVESGEYIVVSGTTNTAAVATVELFFTDQAEQTVQTHHRRPSQIPRSKTRLRFAGGQKCSVCRFEASRT